MIDHLDKIAKAPFLGIIGRAGCGKTTAMNHLMGGHKSAARISFASPLKQMTYEFLRSAAPRDQKQGVSFYMNDGKDDPIPWLGNVTCRRIMQTLGTEWGRNCIHPDIWVGIAAMRYEAHLNAPFGQNPDATLRAISDDVRFANEAEMIRAAGGCILRIVRPEDGRPPETYNHASEKAEIEPDLTIVNDGTVDDLKAELDSIWPPVATKARK